MVASIEAAMQYVKQHHANEEVFIIGGAEIYKQTIAACHKIYLTHIHHSFDGDAFFPELTLDWKLTHEENVPADEKNKYSFTFQTWTR